MSVENIKEKFGKLEVNDRYQLISNAVQRLPDEIRSQIPQVPHDHPEELFGKVPPEIFQRIMLKIQELSMPSVLQISSIVV